MNKCSRRIFSGGRTTNSELAELVQWLFLAELLAPGDAVWFSAPTIDNAPILDNDGGAFDTLEPGWGHRSVRLLDVVLRLAAAGKPVSIVSQAKEHPTPFLEELRAAAEDHGLEEFVRVQVRPWVSSPGILTRHGLLRGALEFGADAIRLVDDVVTFHTAAEDLAAAREAFEADMVGRT